jgi:hypothetical protein
MGGEGRTGGRGKVKRERILFRTAKVLTMRKSLKVKN